MLRFSVALLLVLLLIGSSTKDAGTTTQTASTLTALILSAAGFLLVTSTTIVGGRRNSHQINLYNQTGDASVGFYATLEWYDKTTNSYKIHPQINNHWTVLSYRGAVTEIKLRSPFRLTIRYRADFVSEDCWVTVTKHPGFNHSNSFQFVQTGGNPNASGITLVPGTGVAG